MQAIYSSVARNVESKHLIKEIDSIRVACKHPKLGLTFEKLPILHPHRILSYLFDEVKLRIDPEIVSQFWRHCRAMKEPWALESPGTESHIPIGLHGDGARLLTHVRYEKHVAVWMNLPLWRPRSMRYSRWMLFSIAHNKLYKNRTLNNVWVRLVWSLEACFSGYNPTTRPGGGQLLRKRDIRLAGTPITKNHDRFIMTELRGDWEWHRDVWRPSASWIGLNVCHKCPAMKAGDSARVYYNYGSCAADGCMWVREEFGREQFVAKRLRSNNICSAAACLKAPGPRH